MKNLYHRPQVALLQQRLAETPRFMTVVTGPRQIGKSTMVRQALAAHSSSFTAADQPLPLVADPFTESTAVRAVQSSPSALPSIEWLVQTWNHARTQTLRLPSGQYHVLAIDEIQKIPRWSEVVKGLWDADRANDLALHVVLLGSSPWLMQKGLSESLAGRYELLPMTHWAYSEMQQAFDLSLDEYVYFGGYPGSAALIHDEARWRQYVRNSLIRPNIELDILQMTRVDKPALLKTLFELGCGAYSGQIISYTKLQGQLQDAGNTVTLAHYLNLLSQAQLLTGLPKYAGRQHRQRASSPKLNIHNTALMSALGHHSFQEARQDRTHWGRLVESAVGAHLLNTLPEESSLHYWRESPYEVDFIVSMSGRLWAFEVKSGSASIKHTGMAAFKEKFSSAKGLIVGESGVPLTEFLSSPTSQWLS